MISPAPAILVTIMMLATGSFSQPMRNLTCPTSCGNPAIPNPFGIGTSDCIADDSFLITCNSSYHPPIPFLNPSRIEVLDESLDGQMRFATSVSSHCYDDPGSQCKRSASELCLSKFPISSKQNKFTAALGQGFNERKHMKAELISLCDVFDRLVNGICSGNGCCQSSTPKGEKDNTVVIRRFRKRSGLISFNTGDYYKGFEAYGEKEYVDFVYMKKTPVFHGYLFFFVVLLLGVVVVHSIVNLWIFWRRKQKKVDRLRRSLFLRNGGQLLQGRLQIFRAEELKKATNNYSEDNAIFEVHNGYKHRGILPNGVLVTVVDHDAFEECETEVFTTNLITLSNLSHPNMVRLIGCCLETQIPLLVFERFMLETSLHDYILDDRFACNLSWDIRLRIASETARVIEYMQCRFEAHSIHSCISSSSILLLENGGMVKLQCIDVVSFPQAPFAEWIVSKLGYLDPHYLQTHQFTEKSDVYSFGVVLAEILTGQEVISPHRSQGERLLAEYFIAKTDDDDHDLATILDRRIESDGKIDELTEVAALARRCLSASPSDRPTITEVATTLDLVLSHVSGSETI